MSIAGTWNLEIATPLGKQTVVLELTEENGVITGIAKGTSETVPLIDPTRDGDRLTWAQSVTRPMRLNLTSDVIIDGDAMTGTSKAGMLPTSKVTGHRVA
jgi:hypothetical protein